MRCALFVSVYAIVCLLCVVAPAQDYRGEVHGGYSYVNIDTNGLTSRQSANGWESGGSANLTRWFGVEGSVSGYYKTYNLDLNSIAPGLGLGAIGIKVRDYFYGGGPRLNYKMVFVHALIGADHLSGALSGISAAQNSFAGAFGGGVQQKIAGPIALRVSVDYLFTRHNIFGIPGYSYTQNNYRAIAGFAYTFGGGARREVSVSTPRTERASESSTPASMPIPVLGIAVTTTEGNKGAQIVDIASGSVGDFGGLHRTDVVTSVNGVDVHTPMELAAALSGASGNVKIGYIFRTSALGWMGNVTTVVIGK